MAKLYDLARMTTATTGTGTITLGAAVSGFLPFSGAGGAGVSNGDVISYGISDGVNSECGTGTYTAAGTLLTRTVTSSTNSGAAISLSGTAEVFIAIRAEDIIDGAPISNSIGADVALSNIALYFDGPSVAQGVTGTWFASGTVSLGVSAGDGCDVKLWDGTTIISSGFVRLGSVTGATTMTLSGSISAPAGNIRMSVKNITSTTGAISFNSSGNSKDSTITAFRIK